MRSGADLHCVKLAGLVRAHDNYINVKGLEALVDGQRLRLEGEADVRDTAAPSAKGVLSAERLTYGGYTIEKLRLPFRGDKQELVIDTLTAAYGGGTLQGNASYSMEEKVLTADVDVKNVTHVTPDRPKDDVHINAKVAVLAKVLEDKLQLHSAADTLN